ncbi:MAG: glycosyltransferase family 4 protein [Bacteroidales bacterium]|jgi:glycosyltransferase involved in cell wall biosynthesis|nr:glycosyltransferase family 4 protein [Bacteroidales bacterium]HPA13469.1 glycosyltransferase [Bacteroidales bacterium]HQO07314.1 glycosyltransferase [Bacteroidales bacterium]HQP52746.1 glycosyltransferase [Bacteroidales bacterium]
MKILFSHYGIIYKGGFNRTFNLARGIAALGHEVVFYTCQNGWEKFPFKEETINNVKVFSFPDFLPYKLVSKGFGLLSIFLKIYKLRKLKIDIAHSDSGHRPSAGLPCYYAKRKNNALYVSEWWDYFGKGGQLKTKPFLFRLLLGWFESRSEIKNKRKADAIIVLSELMRKRALEFGIVPQKIYKLHGGANIINLKNDKRYIFERNNYKLLLGYIGLSEGDIDDIIELLKIFRDPLFSSEVLFITYGFKFSDSQLDNFFPYKNIFEFGWIDFFKESEKLLIPDVYILIKENNLVNCSGWPNRFGDYLACGKPIIANLYGELIEFNSKYPNSIIQVDNNEEKIKLKILEILNGNFDLEKIGMNNLNIAKTDYSWDKKSQDLFAIYQDLLQNKK